MQVTKGTWRMREQCVPGSLSSSPTQEPGNEANCTLCVKKILLKYFHEWLKVCEIREIKDPRKFSAIR